MVTLEAVRRETAPHRYPRHVLQGCESALVLFAAAFGGRQDAVWMAEAGLRATCVDLDAKRLVEMASAYPDDWSFSQADAFSFSESAAADGLQWDVVSLDPFTNLMQECANLLPLWCHLARKAVVLGTHGDTDVVAPTGWRVVETLPRSSFNGGVFWTVLQPC